MGAGDIEGAPDVAETEVTFLGNARLKAVALAEATGLPAVADDSGLAVDVLGGAPGVFSARWSGSTAGADAGRAVRDRANLDLLLEQIGDVPDEHRGAAFVCAAVVALPDGRVEGVEGRVTGRLGAGAAGHQRLRLRPGVRPGRRHADPGGVQRRREERDLAPRQRLSCTRAGSEVPPRGVVTGGRSPGRRRSVELSPRASGGTGRRARFRSWCLRVCGFESRLAHRSNVAARGLRTCRG